jgi:ribosomal protein L17
LFHFFQKSAAKKKVAEEKQAVEKKAAEEKEAAEKIAMAEKKAAAEKKSAAEEFLVRKIQQKLIKTLCPDLKGDFEHIEFLVRKAG